MKFEPSPTAALPEVRLYDPSLLVDASLRESSFRSERGSVPFVGRDLQAAEEWGVKTVYRVAVTDFASLDQRSSFPEVQGSIERLLAEIERTGPPEDRKRATIQNYGAHQQLLREWGRCLQQWCTNMPSARALEFLYKPQLIFEEGSSFSPDDQRRAFAAFSHALDARGIRSRGVALEWFLFRQPAQAQIAYGSFACGTATPIVGALQQLQRRGVQVSGDFFDNDRATLDTAQRALTLAGITSFMHRINLLRPGEFLEHFRARFDIVDAIGFLEYLPGDEGPEAIRASTFLQRINKTLKPTGILLTGNMLDTHPQLPVTLYAVGWPYIIPRSVESMLKIFEAAGFQRKKIEIILPNDGVYALYALSPN